MLLNWSLWAPSFVVVGLLPRHLSRGSSCVVWHQPKNIVLEYEDQKTLCDDWGCKPHEAVIVAEFPSSVSCCGGYETRRAI